MYICKFCEHISTSQKMFSSHITKKEKNKFNNDLEIEKYKLETFLGKEKLEEIVNLYKNCEINASESKISHYLFLLGIKRTQKEEKNTTHYKENYLKGIQKKYGKDITNISQVKEVQLKKEETYKNKYGSYSNYLNIHRGYMRKGYDELMLDPEKKLEMFSKIESTCLDRYGHKNFGSGFLAKQKTKISMRKLIDSWDDDERRSRTEKARTSWLNQLNFESSIEKRVQEALDILEIDYIKHLFLWGFNFDLMLRNKILIEVQGDFWHANPRKYIESDLIIGKVLAKDLWNKDKKKKDKANKHGYHVVYLWECDIIKLSNLELIDFIKQEINKEVINGFTNN